MAILGNRIASLRDHLLKLDGREPLSKLSLIVIIALDLFILSILFAGLADHTRQLTSPAEYVPYDCRQVYIDNAWSEPNRLSKLQHLALSGYENISYRYKGVLERANTQVMHPTCSNLYEAIKAIADDPVLHEQFVERKRLHTLRSDLERELRRSRETYNTSLLEEIANKRDKGDGLSAIAATSQRRSATEDEVTAKLTAIDAELNAHPLVAALWQATAADNRLRAELVGDYKRYQYWYAFKKLLWQLLFILPIFLLFYGWSSRSVRRQRPLQTLLASHLTVVAAIPILLKVIELVLDLIPRHFLKNLFRILESLHLIALWHYFVILASVAVALFIIYVIQQKLFNQRRIWQRRLSRGECYACAIKLPAAAEYCPFCGESQLKACQHCHATTPVNAAYCTHCGAAVGGPTP